MWNTWRPDNFLEWILRNQRIILQISSHPGFRSLDKTESKILGSEKHQSWCLLWALLDLICPHAVNYKLLFLISRILFLAHSNSLFSPDAADGDSLARGGMLFGRCDSFVLEGCGYLQKESGVVSRQVHNLCCNGFQRHGYWLPNLPSLCFGCLASGWPFLCILIFFLVTYWHKRHTYIFPHFGNSLRCLTCVTQ